MDYVSLRTSELAYIAAHGVAQGLRMQDIRLYLPFTPMAAPTDIPIPGDPPLLRNTPRLYLRGDSLGFQANIAHKYITPENLDLTGSQTAWLVFSSCAQLNNQGSRHEAQYWANALIRDGTVHGILGYWGVGPSGQGQLNAINRFFNEAYGRTI